MAAVKNGNADVMANKILKRLKSLKKEIDKGETTAFGEASYRHLRSSGYLRSFKKMDPVHFTKDGIARWNGLAITIDVAKKIQSDAVTGYRKYTQSKKKGVKNAKKIIPQQVAPIDLGSEFASEETLKKEIGEEVIKNIRKTLGRDENKINEQLVSEIKAIRKEIENQKKETVYIQNALFKLNINIEELLSEVAAVAGG